MRKWLPFLRNGHRVRVRFLRKALSDLDAEASYLATRYNQGVAENFVESVREGTELLCRHPALGRPGRVIGTRELVMTELPYVLPYRVREDWVEILRVFHTR
jgi:toxin ParE1/3/4